MADRYEIALNFLPLDGDLSFTVYRRARGLPDEERPSDDAAAYRLPCMVDGKTDWLPYWVVPEPCEGFEAFEATVDSNIDLTRRAIFFGLKRSAQRELKADAYRAPDNQFVSEIALVMAEHQEGQELLQIQPYYLRAVRKFGLLVDFHFRLRPGQVFSRRVQQLSLSLDRNFRRNLDYYSERWTRVTRFVEERWGVLAGLQLPGKRVPLQVVKDFLPLAANRLRSRVYVFGDGKESKSQFAGLRDHGPLAPVGTPPRLLFAFREQDRVAARRLATALKGLRQRNQFNFPGFQTLFKADLEIDADPIVLQDLSGDSMVKALERVKLERTRSPGVLPVLILPDGEDNGYFEQKALFSHAGIPTQVCTLRILEDEDALKWAVANLALQVFCKAGGRPWKVRPTVERSLIIGISQSHKVQRVGEKTVVEKYFAFSVMTDSSGLFQKLQVLGEGSDQADYLQKLREALREVLTASAGAYPSVVIHTSFKMKHQEMAAIHETVKVVADATGLSKCRFSVIKINHKSRFFGVNNSVNSLVPFEASTVALGGHEHLVWFEGIFPDKPTVSKAFPGPTHVQFLRVGEDGPDSAQERELLQDLVNLSGANWRGFNAKSAPVSVFYCHLVADLVHEFHDRGLPLPAVHDIRPWFL